jgi:uncharacterized iron-regulated membrane protein
MISKRTLLKVHQWVGLAVCAFVLLQAFTGSLLLFRGGLAQLVDPAGMIRHTRSGEVPLSTVLHAVQASFPGFEVQRVVWPDNASSTYFAHLVAPDGAIRYASVDPGDARVLRTGGIWRFPTEALLAIHFRLLTGKVGLALVMLVGVSILAMAVTGAWYWWPKRGRLKKSLQLNWRLPMRALLRQLHRTVGLAIGVLAALSVATGLLVGGEYLLESGPLTSVSPSGAGQGGFAGVDKALAAARAVYPGRRLRDVRMPSAGKFNACFWAPETSALAVHIVKTTLPEGRVVATVPAQADRSLWVPVLPIHTGEVFGVAGRLLLLLGALGLIALAVTGPIMWWQRRA